MAIGKITIKERSDILIWGHRIKGMFTIGEGYQLKAEHNRHPEINKMGKHMESKNMAEDSLLHLDQGPSICVFCREQEETMEHLTNTCNFSDNCGNNTIKFLKLVTGIQTTCKQQ